MPGVTRLAHHLKVIDRGSGGGEQRQRFSLGVESGERGCLAVLPTACTVLTREHNAERRAFAVGEIAAAEFEQPHAGCAALHVAFRRREQAGEQRGAHDLQFLADRVGEGPRPAANRAGLRVGQEAPGDRFIEAARGGGAADTAFEPLRRGRGWFRDTRGARQRGGRDRIDADDANDFLDQIGRAIDIAACGRREDGPVGLDHEAERGEDIALAILRDGKTAEAFGEGRIINDALARHGRRAGMGRFAGGAAAQIEHETRRDLQPLGQERRIDAAFEARACVGGEQQPLSGARNAFGVEIGAFDDDVGGFERHARILAAHDAADIVDARVVGDDGHRLGQGVALAVEREHLFAVLRLARDEAAAELRAVIDVQRAAEIEHHVIGDVDQGRDRALADCQQAAAHPFGRFPIG